MKKLQFDYWPILRSDDGTNPLILEGQLQDLLLTHWNNKECWPTIELSKEGYENGSVFRKCDIEFDKKHNILNLLNKQTWLKTNETVDIPATIEISEVEQDTWRIDFAYNWANIVKDELHYFNDKFGIGTEKFHFKVNGEAWIANQEIKSGELYKVSNSIKWKATTPLMFEIEEFGWSNQSELTRFIQGVRWTIK